MKNKKVNIWRELTAVVAICSIISVLFKVPVTQKDVVVEESDTVSTITQAQDIPEPTVIRSEIPVFHYRLGAVYKGDVQLCSTNVDNEWHYFYEAFDSLEVAKNGFKHFYLRMTPESKRIYHVRVETERLSEEKCKSLKYDVWHVLKNKYGCETSSGCLGSLYANNDNTTVSIHSSVYTVKMYYQHEEWYIKMLKESGERDKVRRANISRELYDLL